MGVSCDTLGNLFNYVPKYLGNTKDEQLQQLLLKIKKYYIDFNITDQISTLTMTMIRKNNTTSPKLRTRGAETRHLVPFGKILADELLDESNPFENGVKYAMHYLQEAHHVGLNKKDFEPLRLQRAVNAFLLQYKSLEDMSEPFTWHLKPKFHLFAELSLGSDCPSQHWLYRDEEFGGTLARMARSKGGQETAWAVSSRCLQRFACDFDLPFL